jgi:hypothetical protein
MTVITNNRFIKITCTYAATELLRLKLYSFTVVQKLHDAESIARAQFYEAVRSGEVDTLSAHFTDEAWF